MYCLNSLLSYKKQLKPVVTMVVNLAFKERPISSVLGGKGEGKKQERKRGEIEYLGKLPIVFNLK